VSCFRGLLPAYLVLAAVSGFAQVPSFPSGTELVYVRFHVERKGQAVTELRKDQLRVLEDGRAQEIVVLETPQSRERTVLPEVTLVLDVSSSVLDERLLDETIVREALLGSLQAGSRVSVCAFGGRLECFGANTRDETTLMDAYRRAMAFGRETRGSGTRLYASLADLAREPSTPRPAAQRAFIVFTDALDTTGGRVKDAVEAAVAADVRVYAVKLSQAFQDTARASGPFGRGAPNRAMYDYKKLELDALPDETGGRSFEPGSLDAASVSDILREIGREISTEIVVGYEPAGEASGRKRKVKVELLDRSLGKVRNGERTLVR
jgi:VWFA-related protein